MVGWLVFEHSSRSVCVWRGGGGQRLVWNISDRSSTMLAFIIFENDVIDCSSF